MSATKLAFSTAILFAALTSTASAERFSYFGCVLDGGNARYVNNEWTCVYPNTGGGTGTVGPQGPQGEAGPQGPAGETGATGAQGPKGEQGEQGLPGVAGAPGADGAIGLQGVAGPAGADGAQGEKGDKGDTGEQGPQGIAGPAGADGAQGDTGAQGPAGAAGIAGVKGDKGEQGIPGIPGLVGTTGATGEAGDKGETGATGATGEAGPQGPAGDTGATGIAGATGDKGAQGIQGETGPAGPKGETGERGIQGETGAQGAAGRINWVLLRDLNEAFQRVEILELQAKQLTSEYKIGDTGPAGGIVFYVDGNGGGLEVSPENVGQAPAGCDFTLTGVSDTSFGAGKRNTAEYLTNDCAAGSAAELAANYLGPNGDSTGWYLPSKDELVEIYYSLTNNAQRCPEICAPQTWDKDTSTYLSSNERSDGNADSDRYVWGFNFYYSLNVGYRIKSVPYDVLAIRAF